MLGPTYLPMGYLSLPTYSWGIHLHIQTYLPTYSLTYVG